MAAVGTLASGVGHEINNPLAFIISNLNYVTGEVRDLTKRDEESERWQEVVLGDETRLGQVFLHLLVNAAQAIPEGRAEHNEVRVTTRRDERGYAVIEVSDTGVGISSEVLPRIFEPFFTTKPVGEGTGLGLSICHTHLQAMGGDIQVRSEPGRGTAFTVTLPPCAWSRTPSIPTKVGVAL
ncbi:ATP-binding protein [Archangium sp.]|uniref:sensor histidine kinase n=1 Tax=Archangium sp. TaxID=1872627 RepID=UPI00286B35AC|nr:ATP-binding protein [Archangium sp.]